jgi:HemY protein
VVAGYFAFYCLVRLARRLIGIPRGVRAYREERTRTRLRQALNDALLAFFQGRYASAEKSASAALLGDETKGVAAIIAARSAHELGRFTEREQFLDQAKGAEPEVDQARPHDARRPARFPGTPRRGARGAQGPSARDSRNLRLLRLKLQAEQALRNWDEVLATAHRSSSWAASARRKRPRRAAPRISAT